MKNNDYIINYFITTTTLLFGTTFFKGGLTTIWLHLF